MLSMHHSSACTTSCAAVCVAFPCLMYQRVYKPTGFKLLAMKAINVVMVSSLSLFCCFHRLRCADCYFVLVPV